MASGALRALIQIGGVITNVVETLAYPWLRCDGSPADAAWFLSQDIRAEIGSANWKVGQRIPGPAWLATMGRTTVEIASAALGALEQEEWLAADSMGGYVICVPTPLAIPEPTKWPESHVDAADAKRSSVKEISARIASKPGRKSAPPPTASRTGLSYATYVIGVDGLPFVKIGHTTKPPMERLKSLQTGQPMALHLLCVVSGDYESALHTHFNAYRIRGEWFDLSSLGDPVEVVQAAVDEIDMTRRA